MVNLILNNDIIGALPEGRVGREVHEAVADVVGRRGRTAAGSVGGAPLSTSPKNKYFVLNCV